MKPLREHACGFAWMLWRRHRFGLSLMIAYLTGMALYLNVVYDPGSRMRELTMVVMLSLPLFACVIYGLSVFLPTEADVAAAESGYPPFMRLLPVRTAELVFWPMAYGALGIGLGWLFIARFLLMPLGLPPDSIPLQISMLAATLAYFQALSWSPMGVPYLRVALALLFVPALLMIGIGGAERGIPIRTLTAGYLAILPLSYGAAVWGVTRARRGEGRLRIFVRSRPLPREDRSVRREARPFVSPLQAQLWLEWHRNGWNLPLAVGAACAFFTVFVFLPADTAPLPGWLPGGLRFIETRETVRFAAAALLLPLFFGRVMGCGLRKSDTRRKDLTLNPFLAIRPVSTVDLVAVKLRMAAGSALLSWGILLLFEGVWLSALPARAGGREGMLLGLLIAHRPPGGEWAALALLGLLVFWTWRNQISNLAVDFTGRAWIVQATPVATMFLATFILIQALNFLQSRSLIGTLEALEGLPPWLAAAVFVKLALAGWALYGLRRHGLLDERSLTRLAGAWALAAAGLVALMAWLFPDGWASSSDLLTLGAILFLPLARLAAAPLALEWNRHR